jgi:predicted RNase H-like HicB family nuclease
MANKKTLPVLVWKEGNLFVAKLIGIELASQGETRKEAVKNLEEALDLYLEDEGVKISASNVPQNIEVSNVCYA